MKSLRFESLTLISLSERRARIFQFNPATNLILGENHTGKSSLLKSLYWTLGADPATISEDWQNLSVLSILSFATDSGEKGTFTRQGKRFKIFNHKKECIFETASISKALANYAAQYFDISLLLTSRSGDSIVPPPAFLFLPFYIDQDKGWSAPWSSFSSLAQFSDWKDDVIKFHTGQRNNDFYALSAEKQSANSRLEEFIKERAALKAALDRLRKKIGSLPLSFDRIAYQQAVSKLLAEINKVQLQREALVSQLGEINNKSVILGQQVSIAQSALSEIDKDYKYVKTIHSETVLCPTCGTQHDNDFHNKFALVDTAEDYREFLANNFANVESLRTRSQSIVKEIGSTNAIIASLELALTVKKGKIRLADVIEAEGAKKARSILQVQLVDYDDQIRRLDGEIADISRRIAAIEDKKRISAINEYFWQSYDENLKKLAVFKVILRGRTRIPTTVKDTGSEQPRAVLAYNFAIISTLEKFASTPSFPIVIDSPLQQDQDPTNAQRILQFISDRDNKSSQIFVGSVSTHNVKFSGVEITLTQKYSLLQSEFYDDALSMAAEYAGLI
jgi:predicted  nucleic acid-binding Zn-ribbon protein